MVQSDREAVHAIECAIRKDALIQGANDWEALAEVREDPGAVQHVALADPHCDHNVTMRRPQRRK